MLRAFSHTISYRQKAIYYLNIDSKLRGAAIQYLDKAYSENTKSIFYSHLKKNQGIGALLA